MNYYPHHIGDYSRDTAHLSMLEDAAYRRMLDLYYASERPLPLNREGLCRLVRAHSEEEKIAVSVVLGEFFSETKKGWIQKRVEIEIAKAKTRTQAAQENGKKGGRPLTQPVSQQEPSNNPAGLRPETQIKAPKTNNQKPLTKEQGIPPNGGSSIWDFGKLLLTEQGLSLSAAGGLMGAWLRDWDEPTVSDAIRSAAGKANAKAYIIAILNAKQKKGGSSAPKVDI